MEHEMRLHEKPFEDIKSGKKQTEIRLNDLKRRMIQVGDTIVFRKRPQFNESITVRVIGKKVYSEYTDIPQYYSEDEAKKHGIVVFDIALV